MSTSDTIIFFHAPNTRSSGVRILLAELGAPHELRPVNMKGGEQRKPAFLAVNPMGKVPAILHRDALVTEQVAIYVYLAASARLPMQSTLQGYYVIMAIYGWFSWTHAQQQDGGRIERWPLQYHAMALLAIALASIAFVAVRNRDLIEHQLELANRSAVALADGHDVVLVSGGVVKLVPVAPLMGCVVSPLLPRNH